jgi:hypothetical protein
MSSSGHYSRSVANSNGNDGIAGDDDWADEDRLHRYVLGIQSDGRRFHLHTLFSW